MRFRPPEKPARETAACLLNRARIDAGARELRGMVARMGVTP